MDAAAKAFQTYLAASSGRLPRAQIAKSLPTTDRLWQKADRLATELRATGCTTPALGEGFRPYSLDGVERAIARQNLRYTDPLRQNTTFATGWSGCPNSGWRPLFGHGWTLELVKDSRLADADVSCIARTEKQGKDYLRRGNVIVQIQLRSLLPRLRRALASLG